MYVMHGSRDGLPVQRTLAGQLAVGFADVDMAEIIAGQADSGGNVVLFDVHVEGIEQNLAARAVHALAVLHTLCGVGHDVGLKAVEDLLAQVDAEILGDGGQLLHLCNAGIPGGFLVRVFEIARPEGVHGADQRLRADLVHGAQNAGQEIKTVLADGGIGRGKILILARADVGREDQTVVLGGGLQLSELGVGHRGDMRCADLKDVAAGGADLFGDRGIVADPLVAPVGIQGTVLHNDVLLKT